MSGPIVPPLEVSDEADGGSVSGRPITTIEVTDGDLTISGRTATIDTSGSGGTPGGSSGEIQYNDAGAFGGAADFTFTGIGGASPAFTITNSASDAGIYTSTRITLDGGTELSVLTTTDGDDGLLLATGADGLGGPFILLDVVTDPSNLLIKNAEENGTINIQTDSGSGDITLTTVGDLHLIASQTLAFTAATTASVTSTTTNNDMNFNIIADGSGTPLINLKNDTKEVRLTCEDDDKLYVRGPTSGERFTFDASSSTGGITFPDTTTLVSAEGTAILATGVTDGYVLTADGSDAAAWEEAGGGDATYGYVTIDPTVITDIGTKIYGQTVPGSAPYWGNDAAVTGGYTWDSPFFFPFVASHSGALASISLQVATAATDDWYAGIYDVDSNGIPDNLLGKAVMDMSVLGEITQSTFSSTITLTKGVMYYWAYVRKSGSGATAWHLAEPSVLGVGEDTLDAATTCLYYDSTVNDLPLAPTPANFETKGRNSAIAGLLAW